MRRLPFASLLLSCILTACQGDEPGGIEASINQALIQVDPAVPDSNATLTLTVDLQTKGQPEEVELSSLTITQQPVSDSSESLTFEAHMVNTQGDDSIVRLDPHDMALVRVLNDGTTNGDLTAWCRLPVSDSSESLTFEAHMVNTQGDDSIVRMDPHDMALVRVLNDGTTNGDLTAWCRLPVELEVVVATADGEEASATADVMIDCP